jgi:primase-polymerase (primpol)-like protein
MSRGRHQDFIDELVTWLESPDEQTSQTNGHARTGSSRIPDNVVIQKCRAAENAPKFVDLFDHGDTSGNRGDDSAADFALLGILKFYTQDPDQLERLMRSSALARPKWDERRVGKSWLRYSVDNALEGRFETYDWSLQRRRPMGKKLADLANLPYIGKSTKYV